MGRFILKLTLLPLLLAVLLLQWTLTFAIRISAGVFDLAAWLTMRLISLRFFLQSKVFA